MGGASIRARFFLPPEELSGCFTSFYMLECDAGAAGHLEDMLQPEWGNMRFFLGPPPEARMYDGPLLADASFTATGPSSCPLHFRLPTTRMWGVGLLPMGWAKYIGLPASDFVNTLHDGMKQDAFARFRPLFALLRQSDADEEGQANIIRDFFLADNRPVRDERRIAAVHEALLDQSLNDAATLARRSGMSRRTLERICKRHFGFPPQMLIRRQRMMRSLSAYMLEHVARWSEVIDTNYHDQAHFCREFQSFMKMTPGEYGALDHPVLSAFMAQRIRALGSPVQTLDPPHILARG